MDIPIISNLMLMRAAPEFGNRMFANLKIERRTPIGIYSKIMIDYVGEHFANAVLSKNMDRAKKYRLGTNGSIERPFVVKAWMPRPKLSSLA